jgi:hypothetical protein
MPAFGSKLKASQESVLLSAFEKDDELWMAFFSYYLKSKGETDEKIKQCLFELNSTCLEKAEQVKKEGFEEICLLCSEKPLQWSMRVRKLLRDPDYANVFQLYLRSLTMLRTRKIDPADPNGNVKRQINLVLSSLAGEIYPLLEPYLDVVRCLDRNLTPGGKDLTEVSRQYYHGRFDEVLNQISTYLAIIFLVKNASKMDDITRCQVVFRRNLIKPLEVKIEGLKGTEKKESFGKLDIYYKLLWSLDIQFG